MQNRHYELTTHQEEHHSGNQQFKTDVTTLVTLASLAPDIFKSSKTEEKRLPLLKGKNKSTQRDYLFIGIDDFSRELYAAIMPVHD